MDVDVDASVLIRFVPVALVLLSVCTYWIIYVKSQYTVLRDLGIPGPSPVFLFGNSLAFANKWPQRLATGLTDLEYRT
ncbi:hypothetical protein Btru_006542 [Bulinus truncatus]|nr:hypothetical protein Btru_006542 [Bulinus truncatus]